LEVLSVANLLEPGLGKGALASPVSLVDCAKSIAFSVFSKMRVLVHSKIPLPKSPVDLFPVRWFESVTIFSLSFSESNPAWSFTVLHLYYLPLNLTQLFVRQVFSLFSTTSIPLANYL
jgi:hypothetical protein